MKRKNVAYLMALLAITSALMFSGSVNLEKDTSISTSKSTIIIQKFSDTNFNGIVEPDEERLPGWMFIITGPNGTTTTYVTNDRGEIRIEVPEGKYIIVEQLRPGWTSTTPATQVVNVQKGETTVVVFLNAALRIATPTPMPSPSPSLQESIDEILENLPTGKVLFNPPHEMKVGETELVEVRITQNLTEDLTKGLQGRGEPQTNETKVSTYMKVRLTGRNFDIDPKSGAPQIIESDKYTHWEFHVTPLKSGIQTLKLTFFVILLVQGTDRQKEYEAGEWEVNVNVNHVWWLESNWKFLVSTLIAIVALIISIIAILKKNGEKKDSA